MVYETKTKTKKKKSDFCFKTLNILTNFYEIF